MFYILIIFLLLIWIFHVRAIYGKKGKLLRLIPGPPELPFLGNMYHFNIPIGMFLHFLIEKKTKTCFFFFIDEMWDKFSNYGKIYGPTWKIYMSFLYWSVMINHPDDLEVSEIR